MLIFFFIFYLSIYFFKNTYFSAKVFDASTLKQLSEIKRPNLIDLWLSPQGSYLATWERPSK